MNKSFAKIWVGFTLVFIVLELTFINAKSLNYLSGGFSVVDGVFAIIGSIAFSMVTVLVMMLSKRVWLKITFPFFDMALVFCGFNLQFADELLANPIRFYLSIFLAVFTGIITYSLGQINAEQYTNDSKANQIESNLIIEEQKRIIEDLQAKGIESKRIIDELKSNEIDLKGARNDFEKIANSFLPGFIQWENFIGKKKKERNGYEASIEKMANHVKLGKLITVRDYLKNVES